jgi:GH35 family endo-1,4-beta-xylanase
MTDMIRGEEWRHVTPIDQADLAGCPPDAEVLAEARRTIERIRKADVAVRLLDAAGKPLAGVTVRIRQQRHHTVFGCCAGSTFARIAADPGEAARAKHFLELFNGTHAKCYWDENWHQPIEKEQGRRETGLFLAETDWAVANRIEVRGHPLVWTVDKAIPKWMAKYPYEQQVRFLEHHVRSMVALAKGRIRTWDLCNEMLWEPSLRNLAKRDWPHAESMEEMVGYIAPALRWARDEDPTAAYCINEYGLETSFSWIKERHGRDVTAASQRRRMVELARRLADQGCRVDAVGTQAHGSKWYPMGVVWTTFQDLAKAGTDIHVSEFWAHDGDHPAPAGRSDTQKAEDKARYICDYYTVAFGTPGVTQICYWGDDAFFSHGGWRTTPAYAALKKLVRGAWWTDTESVADADGVVRARVFHGDHALTFTHPDGSPRSRGLRVTPDTRNDPTLTIA